MGRHLAYTYEISELVPGEIMVMRRANGKDLRALKLLLESRQ